MSKRKTHNMRARMGRALGAILRSNSVAVVNLDPSGRQGMVNWKNCKNIPPSRRIADAVCDYAHHWTIYLAGLCIDQSGQRYYKAQEVAPRNLRRQRSARRLRIKPSPLGSTSLPLATVTTAILRRLPRGAGSNAAPPGSARNRRQCRSASSVSARCSRDLRLA